MGSGTDDVKERDILGRKLKWTVEGLEYCADEKHRAAFMRSFGLTEESNPVVSPWTKENEAPEDEDEILGPGDATWARGLIARAIF